MYGVPEKNDMDLDKDVFNGRLLPIGEIPTAADNPTPAAEKGDDNPAGGEEEGEEREDGAENED